MHWASIYIGIPYEAGARGPEQVDCWGLVCMAYRDRANINLPPFPGLSLESNPVAAATMIKEGLLFGGDWTEVLHPFDGALVAMSQQKEIHHVGLFADVDSGRVLHCRIGQPVVADTLNGLRLRGMRIIKFYRHRLWPISLKPQTPSSR